MVQIYSNNFQGKKRDTKLEIFSHDSNAIFFIQISTHKKKTRWVLEHFLQFDYSRNFSYNKVPLILSKKTRVCISIEKWFHQKGDKGRIHPRLETRKNALIWVSLGFFVCCVSWVIRRFNRERFEVNCYRVQFATSFNKFLHLRFWASKSSALEQTMDLLSVL